MTKSSLLIVMLKLKSNNNFPLKLLYIHEPKYCNRKNIIVNKYT